MHLKRSSVIWKICLNAALSLLAISVMTPLLAAPFTPSHADEVLADWGEAVEREQVAPNNTDITPNTTELALARAQAHLDGAGKPGQSYRYQLAARTLAPLTNSLSDNSLQAVSLPQEYWLLRANVLQHDHHFSEALKSLDTLFIKTPNHLAGRLMAARISLVMGQPQLAAEHCLALLGQADLLTVAGCSLEARSYIESKQGNSLQDSYRELTTLVERQGLPDDERGPWLVQVLADMATRLNLPEQAAHWLDNFSPRISTHYLAQWADTQLALGNSTEVLQTLAPVVDATGVMDDALLLRLALAEKSMLQVGDDKTATSKNTVQPQGVQKLTGQEIPRWQALMQARIGLREERGDREHAAQMARYYLDLRPDTERALHWARINTLSSREYTDTELLRRAEQMAARDPAAKSEG